MHVVFGLTSIGMLVTTVWMFAEDHIREWKSYQKVFYDRVEPVTTAYRLQQQLSGDFIKRRQLDATVQPFKSRDEAMAALEAGKADAFASDRLLLVGAATKAKDPNTLTLLADQLSLEPYGIVVPRGDTGMRIAVNTGLARIYAGDEIVEIYRRWFGQFGRPTALLEAAYALGAIPE